MAVQYKDRRNNQERAEIMAALDNHIAEMRRVRQAILKTNSEPLKADYGKKYKKMRRELKEYCSYRGIDYKPILSKVEQ